MIDEAERVRSGLPSPEHIAQPARPSRARRPRLRLMLGAALVLLLAAALATRLTSTPEAVSPAPAGQVGPRLTARGDVRAIAQARVGTLGGGVLARLVVEPGDAVSEGQEIARVRGASDLEIVTAPFAGTVTALEARLGDTLLPGAIIATVGDLSALRVETTDVDEFLISRIHRGQAATITVEAINRELTGQVRTVSLAPVTTVTGDEHYPAVIDLLERSLDLRPGMRAKITFGD